MVNLCRALREGAEEGEKPEDCDVDHHQISAAPVGHGPVHEGGERRADQRGRKNEAHGRGAEAPFLCQGRGQERHHVEVQAVQEQQCAAHADYEDLIAADGPGVDQGGGIGRAGIVKHGVDSAPGNCGTLPVGDAWFGALRLVRLNNVVQSDGEAAPLFRVQALQKAGQGILGEGTGFREDLFAQGLKAQQVGASIERVLGQSNEPFRLQLANDPGDGITIDCRSPSRADIDRSPDGRTRRGGCRIARA